MTWADQGRFILVEFGFQRHYPAAMDVVDYFIRQGLTPMIAHPERYTWLPAEPEFFRDLNDRGCVFQFNVMSINGHFGPRTQELAMRLLPAAGAFIIGTDSHHDADRYFDLNRVRETLRSLGMADDNGQFPIGLGRPFPDISDLALPARNL